MFIETYIVGTINPHPTQRNKGGIRLHPAVWKDENRGAWR